MIQNIRNIGEWKSGKQGTILHSSIQYWLIKSAKLSELSLNYPKYHLTEPLTKFVDGEFEHRYLEPFLIGHCNE